MLDRLLGHYPALQALDVGDLEQAMRLEAQWLQVPVGAVLFEEGKPCRGFPMVLDGGVRVARGSPGGRTLELYRVTPGEICVVSTSCLFGQAAGRAQPDAGTHRPGLAQPGGLRPPGAARVLPAFCLRHLCRPPGRPDELGRGGGASAPGPAPGPGAAGHGSTLRSTHQALADELGTVREIVSRLLSRFERAGWVVLGRERIDVLDSVALRTVARSDPLPPAKGAAPV